MKRSAVTLLAVTILLVSVVTSCNIITGSSADPLADLSEMDRQQWEERGIANVDTAEQASALAGFNVKTPGFIPEGLVPQSKFMVNDHLVALGGMIDADAPPHVDVSLFYGLAGERQPVIIVIQGTRALNRGQGEPVTIQGMSVERASFPASGEKPYPSVQYVWEQGGVNCYVFGYLVEGVDETALDRVVVSIINQ